MPCNQVILNKVEIKVVNLYLLTVAIESLVDDRVIQLSQHQVSTERELAERIVSEGFIRVPVGKEFLADRIRQEYSRQAIWSAARKFNWRIQANLHDKNKLTATRRA